MSAFVTVTLDTTAPDLSAEAVQDSGEPTLITVTLTADADAAEVRLWGGIDPTDLLNADYGETQGAAPWIEYTEELIVRAAVGGAPIYVQVRDDVYNESASVLAFGTVVPPETTPTTPGGFPRARPARRVARRAIHAGPSRVRVESRTTVRESARRVRTQSHLGARSRSRYVARMRHRCDIRIQTATAVHASRKARSGSLGLSSETAIRRRPEGPKTEATLIDLDII